ncbi:hypothetical protein NADFUDRAFT_41228 [Nadsonia fulvescens var. elongata DSM 6958]|uniref:Uncharacterized protein n=1 Tax=Nadsonia fulvescens var. elongata DSM 6958 TaxID=857566 RepID=A0A1E3PN24_9ASCO|nr:hypothetical protein NADFUDRAFT_41228 [Nadsonia fulvescens var. elongata DSM 6958]
MSSEPVCFNSLERTQSRSPTPSQTVNNTNNIPAFQQLDNYDWDGDQAFQRGLSILMAKVDNSPKEATDLILEAKIFFLRRLKGISIDFNEYKQWKDQLPVHSGLQLIDQYPSAVSIPPTKSDDNNTECSVASKVVAQSELSPISDVPYSSNFTQIMEMILSGTPIPGIKTIPDTVLGDEAASESKISRRKKPWEKQEN